jgi:hypothetical protein
VKDLKPGVFEERKLNDAIFGATPHRRYGPLQLTASHETIGTRDEHGLLFFEVVRATPSGPDSVCRCEGAVEGAAGQGAEGKDLSALHPRLPAPVEVPDRLPRRVCGDGLSALQRVEGPGRGCPVHAVRPSIAAKSETRHYSCEPIRWGMQLGKMT